MNSLNKILFWILLLLFAITYFTRTSYRKITDVSAELMNEPVQRETKNKTPISFDNNGYRYTLAPLFDYRINALAVSTMDYTWFSIYKRDSVFPIDLCLLWGENIRNKAYKNKNLSFSQDYRFCLYNWRGELKFDSNSVSNNHLIVNNEKLEKKIRSIKKGDQVSISGRLVNVTAVNTGKAGKFDPDRFDLNTSISRSDTGAGACEIIYVDDVAIIKKGHPILSAMNILSVYGLGLLFMLNVIAIALEMHTAFRQRYKT